MQIYIGDLIKYLLFIFPFRTGDDSIPDIAILNDKIQYYFRK